MSLVAISSICRVTQSIRKSGKADTRLFCILITSLKLHSSIFDVSSVIDISTTQLLLSFEPTVNKGRELSEDILFLQLFTHCNTSLVCFCKAGGSIVVLDDCLWFKYDCKYSGVRWLAGSEACELFEQFPCITQKLLFHCFPHHATGPVDAGSHTVSLSSSSSNNGAAATIQFHPDTSGDTHDHGLVQVVLAVPPKQNATPAAPVSVGVTYNLNVFAGDHTHSSHHALLSQQVVPTWYARGVRGCTAGIQHGVVPHTIWSHVILENNGNHSSTLSPSRAG